MDLRTITGTVRHANGSPWPGVEVSFNMIKAIKTASDFFPMDKVVAITEPDGSFTANIAVPGQYKIHTPDNESCVVYLEPGAPTDLQTIFLLSTVAADQNAIQTVIDAANLATIRTVTQATIVVAGDQIIRANGTFAVTLPAATGSGRAYLIKNIGNGTVTVTRAGSDLIDGGATVALPPLDRCSVLDAAPGWWDEL
jgi:hypothetical protein